MIPEEYVSFEIAKILKDKGFDEFTFSNYNENGIVQFNEVETRVAKGYQRPTLQMAMAWLRKIYNIMVSPYALSNGYYFEIFDLTNRDITGCKPLYKVGIPNKEDILNTYEEACDVAIKYVLENLI